MTHIWKREDGTIVDIIEDECEHCTREISKQCLVFCNKCYLLVCENCKTKKGCKSCTKE